MPRTSQDRPQRTRRVRKLFLFGVLGLGTFLLAATLLLFANLTASLNWIGKRAHPEFSVHIGSARLMSPSMVVADDLRISFRGEEMLRIRQIQAGFSVQELRGKVLRRLEIDGPELSLTPEMLRALLPGKTPASDGPQWQIGELTVHDGAVRVSGEDWPVARFAAEIALRDGGGHIAITELQVGDNLISADRFVAEIPPGGIARGELGGVELHGVDVRLTREALALLQLLPPPPPREADAPPATWSVARVQVSEARVSGSNLGERLPDFSFAIEADLTDLRPDSDALHRIAVREMHVSAPGILEKPFLAVETLGVAASLPGLMRDRTLAAVAIEGAHFYYDRHFRTWLVPGTVEADEKAATAPEVPSAPWTLSELHIARSRVSIEDLGEGIPGIDFSVSTRLKDLPLGLAAEMLGEEIQGVELADLTIHSPLDPFAPVMNLRSIFVRFSLAGLMRQEVEELVVLHPLIYVGDDLFWYVDELKRRAAGESAAAADPPPSWTLNRFEASYGRLVIAAGGAGQVALPLNFSTRAENIQFRDVNDLQLQLNLMVPKENYPFPSYQLELVELHGELEFGLPPASGANNLVNTLYSSTVRWRQFLGETVWLSVTFARRAIDAKFGGEIYGGYLDGGFSFLMHDGFPWTGWLAVSGIDMDDFTGVLAPQNFRMSGPADLTVELNATGPLVERVLGRVTCTGGGQLNIGKLDEILAELPEDWTSLKRDLTRIGLETLRDFDYDNGEAAFWFLDKEGRLDLDLAGPGGTRRFTVVLHGTDPNPNILWQESTP